MTTREKVRILKAMRKLIESGESRCLCGAACKVMKVYVFEVHLANLELIRPKNEHYYSCHWWEYGEIPPRLRAIDKAIKKLKG